jgi:hypothetical protein
MLIMISVSGFAQTMYDLTDSKYREISDSLLLSKTDLDFRECIVYERTTETFYYPDSSLQNNEWIIQEPIKGVNVYYQFVDSCNQIYSYQLKGLRRGGFEITFDFDYKIIKQPDYSQLKEITKAHNSCYISYETAQDIAIENSNPKSRKTWTNQLVYDLGIDKVYWLIERESGFRNGVIESIKIDAIDKYILEKTEKPFYNKGLFKAINDCIFKVP